MKRYVIGVTLSRHDENPSSASYLFTLFQVKDLSGDNMKKYWTLEEMDLLPM